MQNLITVITDILTADYRVPASAIHEDRTFAEAGLDSMDRVEFAFIFTERTGVNVDTPGACTTLGAFMDVADARREPQTLKLIIPVEAWKLGSEHGNYIRDDGRLYAKLEINGRPFHCEALPMRLDGEELRGATPVAEDLYDSLDTALGGDSPFQTMQIDGRPSAVFISPHRE